MREKASAAEFHTETGVKTPESRDPQEENVDTYLPLVRLIAERIHRRLPPGIDLRSLMHAGIVGLLEARQRFDPGRGVAFLTYAPCRIRGEIMEYLRSLDWGSRSLRSWGRRLTTARTRLLCKFGREASPEEIASELGVSLEKYYWVDQQVSGATLLSLEDLGAASEEEGRWTPEKFASNPFQDPFVYIEGKDLVEKLANAIEELSERERQVIPLYYHEERTLREIGELLGLTESRISQIHTQAVARLRQALGEKGAGKREAHSRAASPPAKTRREACHVAA